MNNLTAQNRVISSDILYKVFGYKEHRALKKVISKNEDTLLTFGELRVSQSPSSPAGGRPSEVYLLNLEQLLLLTSLAKNGLNSKKIDVAKVIVDAYSNASLTAVLNLISSIDIDEVEVDKFVYVAREAQSGRYKIGISSNPESRVKALNTGNPEKLILVHAYLAIESGYQSEVLAHKVFEQERLTGEWFGKSIDLNLLPSYSASCVADKVECCDCVSCVNSGVVHDAIGNIESMTRDEYIELTITKTGLDFPTAAANVDILEDLGVIAFAAIIGKSQVHLLTNNEIVR